MKLPCSVVRDLLPLYTEELASEESAALVREHLQECEDCRGRLEALRQPAAPAPENAAPIKELKKTLRRRRWRTAAIAALCVFAILFSVLAAVTTEKPIDYREGLLDVEGLRDVDPLAGPAPTGGSFRPDGWQTKYPGQELAIGVNTRVSGAANEYSYDGDTGELTVYLQLFSTRSGLAFGGPGGLTLTFPESDASEDVFYPVPDRVVYGFGPRQELLWGEPMNGGTQILPRLVLSYYALLAAAGAAALGVLWFAFRKKAAGAVFRQMFFAPAAYLLGHLFIKGMATTSIFLRRDLMLICIEAAAFYALLTLVWRALRGRRKSAA